MGKWTRKLKTQLIIMPIIMLLVGCGMMCDEKTEPKESTADATAESTLPVGINVQGSELSIRIPSEIYYLVRTNGSLESIADPVAVTVNAQIVGDLYTKQCDGYFDISCKGIRFPEMTHIDAIAQNGGFWVTTAYFYRDDTGILPGQIFYSIHGVQQMQEYKLLIQVLAPDTGNLMYIVKAKNADAAYDVFYELWMDIYGQ